MAWSSSSWKRLVFLHCFCQGWSGAKLHRWWSWKGSGDGTVISAQRRSWKFSWLQKQLDAGSWRGVAENDAAAEGGSRGDHCCYQGWNQQEFHYVSLWILVPQVSFKQKHPSIPNGAKLSWKWHVAVIGDYIDSTSEFNLCRSATCWDSRWHLCRVYPTWPKSTRATHRDIPAVIICGQWYDCKFAEVFFSTFLWKRLDFGSDKFKQRDSLWFASFQPVVSYGRFLDAPGLYHCISPAWIEQAASTRNAFD